MNTNVILVFTKILQLYYIALFKKRAFLIKKAFLPVLLQNLQHYHPQSL